MPGTSAFVILRLLACDAPKETANEDKEVALAEPVEPVDREGREEPPVMGDEEACKEAFPEIGSTNRASDPAAGESGCDRGETSLDRGYLGESGGLGGS